MIDDKNKNEAIEKYLQGELDGAQLTEFKEKLAADDRFRKEVALEQAIVRNLKKAGRSELRLKLENFHQEMGQEIDLELDQEIDLAEPEANEQGQLQFPFVGKPEAKVIQLNPRQYFVMAAASIALILACTLTFRTIQQKHNTPEAIFESYYEPYDDLAVTRDIPTKIALKNEASLAYNEGNYRKSIQLFKILLEKEPDEVALFYLGNAYLSANMPLEAIETFEAYLKKYKEYEVEAKWYLSLSYLKAGKDTKAKKLLKELATETNAPDPVYQDKAREILSKYDAD